MSRIFLSHSSANNGTALAFQKWMVAQGWDDLFLDIDLEHGLVSGERWEKALRKAANRCESVIFLISKAWLESQWCRDEFNLARHLNKRLFGVVIEDLPISQLPETMTREWQITNLAVGDKRVTFEVTVPPRSHREIISFAEYGLHQLRIGLLAAGLDPKHFAWPPINDPNRSPYRGLRPLEAEDAGIFFGRDGTIVAALDKLRSLRDAPPPRLLVILGASGAGKSSFMRAGLLPRLVRDDRHFLTLPVIRPERAVIHGEAGFIDGLESALKLAGLARTRSEVRKAVDGGARLLRPLLTQLVEACTPVMTATEAERARPPTLLLPIDQAEELFLAESAVEAEQFLSLLRELASEDMPALAALFTIRSDSYETLQAAAPLIGITQQTFSLQPMPRGAYANVIEGPARRLHGSDRSLNIEEPLVQALLADIEAGGAKDALPLLAFTLERLYREYGGDGDLRLREYEELGRVEGSIEAAVERALQAAEMNPSIPRDHNTRLALLRRGLIPWIAGLDPETGWPRRRVATLSEIPAEARPLIDLLVEQRLLTKDVNEKSGDTTVEPAHEALLRQWSLLRGWLNEDASLLGVLDGVQRASRDWAANSNAPTWLTHAANRLEATDRLRARNDLAASLKPVDLDYLAACREVEKEKEAANEAARQRYLEIDRITRGMLEEELRIREAELRPERSVLAELQEAQIELIRSLLRGKWHPQRAVHVTSTQYSELFRFPCCDKFARDFQSSSDGDPPSQFRSDGCREIPKSVQYETSVRSDQFHSVLVSRSRSMEKSQTSQS